MEPKGAPHDENDDEDQIVERTDLEDHQRINDDNRLMHHRRERREATKRDSRYAMMKNRSQYKERKRVSPPRLSSWREYYDYYQKQ